MKIKNIQQYRKIYKEEIRKMPDRNENFIGNFYTANQKRIKGWFDLYFGDADGSGTAQEGVNNKLKSFLDMAKDGQAIYEFLQNAVDAGGSKFLMFYKSIPERNEDYLLVINNGEMFTPSSIRSILNIGSSTKTNETEKIGQFGIGFKLAHRLVGKDNALDELINNLNGPILFSWKNNEINNLANNLIFEEINYEINEEDDTITINDNNPWLFKILLTTFPCAYNEIPIIWDGNESVKPPFSNYDLSILIDLLSDNKIKGHIQNGFKEGSLFLMKLGDGKLKELQNEPNLKEGVRFSLAVLKETSESGKGLQTAIINGEEVFHPDLLFHSIKITKKENLEDYTYIRFGKNHNELNEYEKNTINSESDIEILFGYRNFNEIDDFFKGSPSFYLYFPVSQEVHNFNYIIHSNALYKGSSRVFLQSGGESGLNERLFAKIVEKIGVELKLLFNQDLQKFKNLYAAFLTSDETQNNQSRWITEHYTKPLNNLLKTIIPVKDHNGKKSLLNGQINSSEVYLIESEIEILQDAKYFIFENKDISIDFRFKAFKKLGLKTYNVYDILNVETAYKAVNNWLGNNSERINLFYKELIKSTNNQSQSLNLLQKTNLTKIKWITLTDDSNISIEDIRNKPILLLNSSLYKIQNILTKLNFVTSKNDLNDFIEKFRSNFQQNELKQFTYVTLTKIFSDNVKDLDLDSLTKIEKFQVFETFRTLDDMPRERLKLLKIYKNNIGVYQPLKNLSNKTGGLLGLLSIDNSQLEGIDRDVLDNYLKIDGSRLYENLYYPQWDYILKYLIANDYDIDSIVNDLDYAYNHSNWDDIENHPLSDRGLFIFMNELLENESYIIPGNNDFSNYETAQENLLEYYGIYLPDQKFIKLFSEIMPFGYQSGSIGTVVSKDKLSLEDVFVILNLARDFDIPFFENNTIQRAETSFKIISSNNKQQYISKDERLIDFLRTYYEDDYELLPEEFGRFSDSVILKGYKLREIITEIDDLNENDEFINEILALAQTFDEESRKKIFDKIYTLKLCFDEEESVIYNALKFIESIQSKNKENIQEKIILVKDEVEINLSDVIPTIPTLQINNKEFEFDKIIENQQDENLALEFFNRFINQSDLNKDFFKNLLKLSLKTEDLNLKEIFENSLSDGNEIVNIYQLYFLVFSGYFDNNEIGDFYVLNGNEDFITLDSGLTCRGSLEHRFFDSAKLINDCYFNVPELLKDIIDKEGFDFIQEFYITDDTDYSLLNLGSEINLIEKINFLYEVYLQWPHTSENLNLYEIDNYLGIDQDDKIIVQQLSVDNGNYIEISNWILGDDNKKGFLKKLNFKFEDSSIIRFINSVISSEDDFSEYNVYSFTDEEVFFIVDYLFKKDISFSLGNNELKAVLIKLYNRYYLQYKDRVLVYNNKENFAFSDNSDLSGFDYTIIDQIFENATNETLTTLFESYKILLLEIKESIDNQEELKNIFSYEIIVEETEELSEYYYKEWKEKVRNINIYKADNLIYGLFTDINGDNFKICEVSYKDDFWLKQIGNQLALFYTSNKSLKSVVEHFTNESYSEYDSYNLKIRLEYLEEIYNSFNATVSDVLERTSIEEFKEYFQVQIHKEERKNQRENIKQEIRESIKYSKNWFLKYLEFLDTMTEKSTSSNFQQLRFGKIEKTDKPKFYKLSACSSVIPESIDESKDVKIKIYSGKQVLSLDIRNISQKNQTVLVQLEADLNNNLIKSFFIAEITYTPIIDLLGRLTSAFKNLEDWDEIKVEFPPIHYIYGPPGTGKTTHIKDKIIKLSKENPDIKILVLTPTNKACDVLAERLHNDEFDDFVRLSSPTSISLPEEMYKNNLSLDDLGNINVLISTIHRHSYFKVKTEHSNFFLYNLEDFWDYLIIDEASMINLPYITFSSLAAKQKNQNCKLIIAGDPKQIPPIPELADSEIEEIGVETENIYSMFGLNSFIVEEQAHEKREIDSVKNLPVQYRSLPAIGNLFSCFSYDSKVENYRPTKSKKKLPKEVEKLLSQTITFLDVPLTKENQLFSINKLIYSSYHLYSGLLIFEFIRFFDKHNINNDEWTIGVISPYKAQSVLSSRLIADLKLKTNINVLADTVHGFQGDECDIIFFISNPSGYGNTPHPNSLLAKDFIYNVAISRAKDYLVVVNPFSELTGNNHINELKRIQSEFLDNKIRIVNASVFEQVIFGRTNFIDENTFITNHDNINVYNEDVYNYYIKKNQVSIDIQISGKDKLK